MKVLVLNCGSSSLKYQLFDMSDESVLAKGLVERIGIDGSRIKHTRTGQDAVITDTPIPEHKTAVKLVLKNLLSPEHGALKSLDELKAVGHRVVHGGDKFAHSVIVDESVLSGIEEVVPLAPLHNPANLTGIKAMMEALPGVPQITVFDTAFHQTMPPEAFIYGVPYRFYKENKIRRYGFHGTSHFYVACRAAEILGKPIEDFKVVTCHLGNGSSITAVKNGKSIDTTLGYSTCPGVLMGTRCGDIDPVIALTIMEQEGLDTKAVNHILNKESGVLGISGVSSDLRDVEKAAGEGNERAQLAIDLLCYHVRRYIGAYAAAMGGLDAIVFTAGIGENSIEMREKICQGLEFLGATFDSGKNKVRGKEQIISTTDSKAAILVVPTNEELVIARDTVKLVSAE